MSRSWNIVVLVLSIQVLVQNVYQQQENVQDQPDIQKLEPGVTVILDIEGQNDLSYFKWIIPHGFDYENSTISVTVRYQTSVSVPTDIYISTGAQLPQPDQSMLVCKDICIFRLTNLQEPNNTNIYNQLLIRISTSEQNDMQIELSMDIVQINILGDATYIQEVDFPNQVTPILYRVSTPYQQLINNKFNKVIFQLRPENPGEVLYTYQMVLFNNELMKIDDVQTIDGWDNTRILVIDQGNQYFCNGQCNYIVGLLGDQNTKFQFKVDFENDQDIQLSINKLINLVLIPNTNYQIEVKLNKNQQNKLKGTNKTLVFEFMIYSGEVLVGINPDIKPNSMSYQWSRNIVTRSVISLRKEKRQQIEVQDKIYYMQLTSEIPAAFSILVFYEQPEYNQILEFSVVELDQVDRDEILNYIFLPLQVQTDLLFTINLQTQLDQEVGLVVKRCIRGQNKTCIVTLNDYLYSSMDNVVLYTSSVNNNNIRGQMDNGNNKWSVDQGVKQLVVQLVHEGNKQYYYSIGIIGITETAQTSIVIKPDIVPIDFQDQKINVGYLEKGDEAEYLYKIDTWSNVSQVNVLFYAVSGSAYVNISTNDPQINQYNIGIQQQQQKSKDVQVNFDIPLGIYSDENKVIRLRVFAVQQSCFFKAVVTYIPREYIQDIHTLYSGYTILHRLLPSQKYTYFGFTLGLTPEFQGYIVITISPNTHDLDYQLMLGKPNQVPKDNNNDTILYTIQNPETTILINGLDQNILLNGDYIIKFSINNNNNNNNKKGIKFWIRYEIIDKINDIKFGYPLNIQLVGTQTDIYKFPYTEKMSDYIDISVAAWSDELDVIIEVWSNLEVGTYRDYKQSVLNKQLIALQTGINQINVVPSTIYIFVHNRKKYNVNYTITLSEERTEIILQESIPTPATLSRQSTSSSSERNFMYYIVNTTREIRITLQAWTMPMQIQAFLCKSIKKCEVYQPQNLTLVSTSLQTIEIDPSDMQTCSRCTLRIKTYSEDISNNNNNRSIHIIQITQISQVLIEGTQTLGYVKQQEIQYYQFHIPRRPLTCKLVLTTLGDGKAYMVALRNQQVEQIQFSDIQQSNYTSSAQVTFTYDNTYGTTEQVTGYYTVEVKGGNNCTFLLVYYYSYTTEIKVAQGYPFEIYLTQSQIPVNLVYYHYQSSGFEILTLREGGPINIIVSTNTEQIIEEDTDIFHVNTKKYCTYCTYNIKLQENPIQPSQKVTVYVTSEREPLFLQVGKPIVDTVQYRSYNIYAFPFAVYEEITLTIIIYYGEISVQILSENEDPQEKEGILVYEMGPEDIYNKNTMKVVMSQERLRDIIQDKYIKGIYIKIATKEKESRYSLIVHGEESRITLRDGYIYYGQLLPSDTQTFDFAASPYTEDIYNQEGSRVSIFFEIDNYKEGIPLPDFNVVFDPDWGIYELMQLIFLGNEQILHEVIYTQKYLDDHHGKIHLEFEVTRSGVYHIDFTNQVNNSVYYNYTVAMQSHQITEVALNVNYYSFLREGNTKMYHIYINEKGYLLISLVECYGQLSIHAASSYSNIVKGKYDIKVNTFENLMETKLKIKIGKPKDIYIKVSVVDGAKTKEGLRYKEPKEAYYSLRFQLIDKDVDFSEFYQGGDGKVSWSRVDPGAFLFDFYKIIQSQGENTSNKLTQQQQYNSNGNGLISDDVSVNYKVYVAKDEIYLDLVSRCGGIMSSEYSLVAGEFSDIDRYSKMYNVTCNNNNNTIIDQNQQQEQQEHICKYILRLYDTNEPHGSETYYATVIAEVTQVDNGYIYRIPYDVVEFKTVVVYRIISNFYYLGFGTVLLVALGYVCIVFFNKFLRRKVNTTSRDIELLGLNNHEGRNTVVSIGSSNNSKR